MKRLKSIAVSNFQFIGAGRRADFAYHCLDSAPFGYFADIRFLYAVSSAKKVDAGRPLETEVSL